MPATLPPVPVPPPPTVSRYKPDGTPTTAQVTYEATMQAFLKALAATIGKT